MPTSLPFSSSTTTKTIERFDSNERITTTTYLPTGEPQVIKRELSGTSESVVRWMRYDSLGRMVLNVEPNTTVGFDEDPETDPDELLAWRYAYNDAGDLVGTSDARGCGVNFAYDGAGRLLYEDYSPCLEAHAAYSAPQNIETPATTDGVEVLYFHDSAPPIDHYPGGWTFNPSFLKGHLVAVYDRASVTVFNYDGLDRVFETGVRVAKPGVPDDLLDDRYAPHWYERAFSFDSSDRELASTTGATVSDLQGATETLTGSTSAVRTTYTARGTIGSVNGSYGGLVNAVTRDADGLVTQINYGDATSTTTTFSYDERRRLTRILTDRGTHPNPDWTTPPLNYLPAPSYGSSQQDTYQEVLQDEELILDYVGNPTTIYDNRNPDYWPADADPVHREFIYDDLYRLTYASYTYPGDDTWTSPFDAENGGASDFQDPRRAKPSPHTDFAERIHTQYFDYDWLGNTSSTDDDAHGFYDRSLGVITNDTANDKPYQLKAATNKGASPADRDGELEAAYDAAGNLVRLQVERDQDFCLPAPDCSEVFSYEWDEVGRLVKASRWDVSTLPGITDPLTGTPNVRLVYAYDAGDERVIKTAIDSLDNEIHTLYVFKSLELRRAEFTSGDYVLDKWTEVPYLFADDVRLARVAWEETNVPTLASAQTHVFFELGDHLGSTSVVLDSTTGELVERSTTQAYGAAETDFRPDRWKGFREDYRFTGKEEDIEVGLAYFGARFLSPYLQRWLSVDPLERESPGDADANSYAYVRGRALVAVDPRGLVDSAPGTAGRAFLRDKAVKGASEFGFQDLAEFRGNVQPAATYPLNNPEVRQKLGFGYTSPAKLSPDHIVSFDEIASEPNFQRLTLQQQLEVLRMKENVAMLGTDVNSSKQETSLSEYAKRNGVDSAEIRRIDARARKAVFGRINALARENQALKINVAEQDALALKYWAERSPRFRGNQLARAVWRRVQTKLPKTVRGAIGRWPARYANVTERVQRIRLGVGRAGGVGFGLLNAASMGFLYWDIHDGVFPGPPVNPCAAEGDPHDCGS